MAPMALALHKTQSAVNERSEPQRLPSLLHGRGAIFAAIGAVATVGVVVIVLVVLNLFSSRSAVSPGVVAKAGGKPVVPNTEVPQHSIPTPTPTPT
ncbi:MAG: hypothetical protein WCL32_15140, partial [Planctomycetota bacterium]